MISLSNALRFSQSSVIAFVGSGGKTSALFQTAKQLAPSIVTTSTHLGEWQNSLADRHFIWEPGTPMPELEFVMGSGSTLVTGLLEQNTNRYRGVTASQMEQLRQLAGYHNLPLLIDRKSVV